MPLNFGAACSVLECVTLLCRGLLVESSGTLTTNSSQAADSAKGAEVIPTTPSPAPPKRVRAAGRSRFSRVAVEVGNKSPSNPTRFSCPPSHEAVA
eukprot:scaffold108005_cov37-Tisochrysis_lutea.AAC.3